MTALRPCVILDLDGTISDDLWRLEFIDHAAEDPFARYHSVGVLDYLINRHLFAECPHDIFILTARPLTAHDWTVGWLKMHGVPFVALRMRGPLEFRGSAVIKHQWACELQRNGYEIVAAYDDRQDVINAYRRLGIPAQLVTR